MRRKDREVTDFQEIVSIIRRCDVCRLALSVGDAPYIVPMNFGFEAEGDALTLYFHSAAQGRKIDMLNANPGVCFEMDAGHHLISGPAACDYTMEFESVIGFGRAEIVTDEAEKRRGLDALMRQLGAQPPFEYREQYVSAVAVIRVTVDQVTAKRLAKK